MIGIHLEDMTRLGHLAVRQHAVLAHLLLDLLRLREEPSIEALRFFRRSGEVVDAGLGHGYVLESILLSGQVANLLLVLREVIQPMLTLVEDVVVALQPTKERLSRAHQLVRVFLNGFVAQD